MIFAGDTYVSRVALLALVLFSFSVWAQDEASHPEGSVKAEVLSLKIAEVEASASMDEQTANSLVELYRKSLTNLERARVEKDSADAFAETGLSALDKIAKVRREYEQLSLDSPLKPGFLANQTLSELEQSLTEQKTRLNDTAASLTRFRDRLAGEAARPGLARERLTEARKELDRTVDELNSPAPIGEASQIAEARNWYQQTRVSLISAEIQKLDQELLSHPDRMALLEAQQELAVLESERSRSRTRMLEEAISQRRGVEVGLARQAAEAAQQELEGRLPVLRELAAANVEISEQLAQRLLEVQIATEQRDAMQRDNAQFEEQLHSTKSKLAIAGLNVAVGQLLVEQKRQLPNIRELEKQLKNREKEVSDVALEQIYLVEQRRDLRSTDRFIGGLTADLPADQASEIYPELHSLAANRLELVEKSIENGGGYLIVLGELDLAHRQLIETVRSYNEFLGKRLLWVRNTAPIRVRTLASIPADIERLLSGASWNQFVRDFVSALQSKFLFIALFAGLLFLGLKRSRFLARVEASARYLGRIRDDRFNYSIEALVFTALAAVPFPLLIVFAGKIISLNVASSGFSEAAASAMVLVGLDLLFIQFFTDTCRDNGLALRHCGWTAYTVSKLRNELRWFRILFPALRLLGEISLSLDSGPVVGGLAVLCLTGAGVSLAVLVFRLFVPDGGILRDFLAEHPKSLVARLHQVWSAALIAIVLLLVVLWLSGYIYTSAVLVKIFMNSMWLMLWLMVLQSLITRWLLLSYRRLEFNAESELREARHSVEHSEDGEGGKDTHPEVSEIEFIEPEIDYAELNSDSRKLLKAIISVVAAVSLWIIWSPVLPALGILEDVSLWTRMVMVNGESVQMPVTLMDLLIAVLVGVATGVCARGLPSLVSLVFLQKTTMSTGSRYTATTLIRYAIVGSGVIAVFGILGGSWSQIQWLVAALGVGIGFGLQEIVANFISGLIILFERPLRVGDIVSVGDTSGVVTRIQIRATTIRDWDRRELLVPNREFVTGRLLNWTLSDTVNRTAIEVGIAYSSDLELAMRLIKEVAQENSNVLDDPPPFAVFQSFGESALNIKLLVYFPSMDNRVRTCSELNVAIKQKFDEAGISIAFPQRDIHLDTSKPLEFHMLSTPEEP